MQVFNVPFTLDGITHKGCYQPAAPEEAPRITGADDVIERSPDLTLWIDYPVQKRVEHRARKEGGNWTRAEFALAVTSAYRKIFEEQARDGRHYTWHGIGDLFLEGAEPVQGARGVWSLAMGS